MNIFAMLTTKNSAKNFFSLYDRNKFSLFFLLLISCVPNDKDMPLNKNLNPESVVELSTAMPDFFDDEDDEILENEAPIPQEFFQKISISVNENMPIKEVLRKLAENAKVNIFLAPDLEGGVSFQASSRPFLDIIKDICNTLNFKYSVQNNCLKIENDIPILKTYRIDFLNITRNTQNSISTSTDIFSMQQFGGKNNNASSSQNNGSNSLVTSEAKSDFWAELEGALKAIINDKNNENIAIHKQAGLVNVFAPKSKHDEIEEYIKLLKNTTQAQVLIEAKILEVSLFDDYKSGVNWDILKSEKMIVQKPYSSYNGENGFNMFSIGVNRNFNIIAQFIEKFGAVKTLSSPRITVLNNQSAILKVAQNEVIYLPELQRQYASITDSRGSDFISTSIKTIPIGLVMSVHPSIDTKNNTIIITLRPTISRIERYKEVPFFYKMYNSNDQRTSQSSDTIQTQKIPIVDVREFDSVLKLKSGQVVVMGGLMQEVARNEHENIPGFYDTPIDLLTGAREKALKMTELVIFLRAKILHKKSKAYHPKDNAFFKKFADDPRPFPATTVSSPDTKNPKIENGSIPNKNPSTLKTTQAGSL